MNKDYPQDRIFGEFELPIQLIASTTNQEQVNKLGINGDSPPH